MSRDSAPTYLHLHSPHHADLFEEFCRPPSSTSPTTTSNPATNPSHPNNTNNSTNGEATTQTHIPGSFLPYEEIMLPPHLMPLNPEDEDDVVPDMHAAFGINRALNQHSGANSVFNGTGINNVGQRGENSGAGVVREQGWRDLGMEGILDGGGERGGVGGWSGDVGGGIGRERAGGVVNGVGSVGRVSGARREGRRTGLLLLR